MGNMEHRIEGMRDYGANGKITRLEIITVLSAMS